MARSKTPDDSDDAPLKRLGGGRWQTRDERFTIEPQSGTWVVVDAEQTDDLGLPLVRGPFPSLTAAKGAISTARSSEPAASPLAARIERRRSEPPVENVASRTKAQAGGRGATKRAGAGVAKDIDRPTKDIPRAKPRSTEPPAEPGWLTDLEPTERGRARRLLATLTGQRAQDPEGLVRRDLVGDVPAVAAYALTRRLAALPEDASVDDVAEILANGRDDELGVRWRVVDAAGRPILLEPRRSRRR